MIDVETDIITPRLTPRNKFWGLALEGEPYRRFESTEDMRHYLSRRSSDDLRLYMWSDYEVCQAIADGILPENLMMRGGRVLRCNVEGVPWVNAYALFPTPLSKLLKTFGYKKLPLTAGHELGCEGGSEKKPCPCPAAHEMGCECPDCERILGERNISDCVEGLDALIKAGRVYEEAFGFDPVRTDVTTAAKACMLAAESLAGPLPLFTERREAYRGGRTEAFQLYDCGEVDCWDIKSSYPFSFVDLPQKDRMIHAAVKLPPNDPRPQPFFREAAREEGLLFPCGEFDTWFLESTYERYIQPHFPGTVRRVYEALPVDFTWIKNVVPLVRRGYELKQKGGALAYPAKIALNSLYGRMGLKPEATISYRAATPPPRANTHFKIPSGGYYVFETVAREIRQGANYLFAAAVTDNARGRLLDGMLRLDGPVFYCDTDSIFCPAGTTGLVSGTELGAWEKIETGALTVRTVKDYEFAGTVKLKGGASSKTWTVKLALAGKPVRGVRRRRGEKSRYSKRRVLGGGSTLPLVVRE